MAEVALKDLSVDNSVRVLEKLREKWVSDQVTHFEYAEQKGMKKGMEKGKAEGMQEGMEKGKAEGMQEGMEKGKAEGMQAVALNMLKEKADIGFICKVTGFSEDEINKLKNGSN